MKPLLAPDLVKPLMKKSDIKGALMVIHAYAVMASALAVYGIWPNMFTALLAIVVISGRQLGLAVLQHEASHGLLFNHKSINDWVGQWLCAAPIFADLLAYRHSHIRHHRFCMTQNDPDLGLVEKFPVQGVSLWRKVMRDALGITGIKLRLSQCVYGLRGAGEAAKWRHAWSVLGRGLTVNVILWAIFSGFGYPEYYGLFWCLPLLTGFMVFIRQRSQAEHALCDQRHLGYARTTYVSWIMRALCFPYYVNYHIEHHLYMAVPCYNLPKVHKYLCANAHIRDQMNIAYSYTDVWQALKGKLKSC